METIAYKCINCGGPLEYNAQKLKFACEYCRSEYTEQQLKDHFGNLDDDLDQQMQSEEQSEQDQLYGTALYSCNSCGAEVIAETENTAATFCVYCHSPVVISNRLTGQFRPNKVIPFKISEEDAKNKFREFCKKKKFLPGNFLSDAQLDMMKGVYYPYWLVDSNKDGGIRATAKKVKEWKDGDYEYKETKIYRVVREGRINFTGYPHTAINDENHAKALKYVNPFDDEEFRPFTMAYLSGFLAEKRDLERTDVQSEVDKELADYAKKIYRETVEGYDSVTIDDFHIRTLDEHWDYGLMPVWLMTFKYNDKDYMYAMNGQTGKNYGELPVSGGKLAILGVGMFILFSVLAFFLLFGGASYL